MLWSAIQRVKLLQFLQLGPLLDHFGSAYQNVYDYIFSCWLDITIGALQLFLTITGSVKFNNH